MAFWNKTPDAINPTAVTEQLENTQQALAHARRRLLGAAVLLAIACGLIPWILDNEPRSWGDDVILRMPKTDQPYQIKPTIAPSSLETKSTVESKP